MNSSFDGPHTLDYKLPHLYALRFLRFSQRSCNDARQSANVHPIQKGAPSKFGAPFIIAGSMGCGTANWAIMVYSAIFCAGLLFTSGLTILQSIAIFLAKPSR